MPTKSDFSIRSLIPQRPPKPFHDRRARRPASPIVVGGVESRAEIMLPVPPLPPTPPHDSQGPFYYARHCSRESPGSSSPPTPAQTRTASPLQRSTSPTRSRSAAEVRRDEVPTPDAKVYRVTSLPCPPPPPRTEWCATRPSRPATTPLFLPPVLAGAGRRAGPIIVPVTVLPAREESASMDETSPVGATSPTASAATARKMKKATRRGRGWARRQTAWAFPENVSELFAGGSRQLFRRVVADEMLTPEQVEDFRRRREWAEGEEEGREEERAQAGSGGQLSSSGGRGSAESTRGWEDDDDDDDGSSDGGEKPLEPFYLDALAWRIQAMLGPPPPLPPPPPPPPAAVPEVPARRGSQKAARRPGFSVKRKAPPSRVARRPVPDSVMPTPPPRNPAREQQRGQKKRKKKQKKKRMTTIPESQAVARGAGGRRIHCRDEDGGNGGGGGGNAALEASEDANFVFLPSTPCTLTAPGFRHGRVRIAKADLDPGLGVDGGPMDWTAFQMAILCAGPFPARSPPDEDSEGREGQEDGEEEEEARGLRDWFGGFGFESEGTLRTGEEAEWGDEEVRWPSMVVSAEAEFDSSSSCYSFDDGDIDDSGHVSDDGRQGDLHIPPETERPPLVDHATTSPTDASTLEEPESIGADELERSEADAAVHMGCNLGNDLGDFLKWEAENVYAVEVP